MERFQIVEREIYATFRPSSHKKERNPTFAALLCCSAFLPAELRRVADSKRIWDRSFKLTCILEEDILLRNITKVHLAFEPSLFYYQGHLLVRLFRGSWGIMLMVKITHYLQESGKQKINNQCTKLPFTFMHCHFKLFLDSLSLCCLSLANEEMTQS